MGHNSHQQDNFNFRATTRTNPTATKMNMQVMAILISTGMTEGTRAMSLPTWTTCQSLRETSILIATSRGLANTHVTRIASKTKAEGTAIGMTGTGRTAEDTDEQ